MNVVWHMFMGHLGWRIWWWYPFLNLMWGKVNVRSNQVKFPSPKFCYKNMSIFFIFISGFHKYYLFLSMTIRNAKKRFENVTSSPLLFCNCAAKNKNIALKFACMLFLCTLTNIFLFLITWKFWILSIILQKKIKIFFFGGGLKTKNIENQR